MSGQVSLVFFQAMKHRLDREKYTEYCTGKEMGNLV
jgi:hypothetical protein